MNNPLISIITVSFNAVSTIEKTILSVINQTYPNIEYIIIDGGSTDGTVNVIKKYSDKITHWVSEPDKGIYDAMNKGIAIATGEWINFMNAGDIFKTTNVIKDIFYNKCINASILYGDAEFKDIYETYIFKARPIQDIMNIMPFSHPSVFIKGDLHKNNPYDTKFRSSGDYNFFLSMYKQNVIFKYMPIVISTFDATEGMSKDNYIIVHKEDAIIKGIKKNLLWYINLYLKFILFKAKRILKKFLPEWFVKNINRRNLRSNKFIILNQ